MKTPKRRSYALRKLTPTMLHNLRVAVLARLHRTCDRVETYEFARLLVFLHEAEQSIDRDQLRFNNNNNNDRRNSNS